MEFDPFDGGARSQVMSRSNLSSGGGEGENNVKLAGSEQQNFRKEVAKVISFKLSSTAHVLFALIR